MMTEQEFNEWLQNRMSLCADRGGREQLVEFTPAHYAAEESDYLSAKARNRMGDILEYILKHNPEYFTMQDKLGETPAYRAAFGNSVALKFIAENFPDTLYTKTECGNLPAYIAAFRHEFECLDIIAKYAPETLHMRYSHGQTIAHAVVDWEFAGDNTLGFERKLQITLNFIGENAPETFSMRDDHGLSPADYAIKNNRIENLKVIAKYAPETLPLDFFDKSKENKTFLKDVFKSVAEDMKKNNDGTKEYVQKCAERIEKINKIVDEKTKEYQQKIKEEKVSAKEKQKQEKELAKSIKKLGKGKGE